MNSWDTNIQTIAYPVINIKPEGLKMDSSVEKIKWHDSPQQQQVERKANKN